MPFTQEQIVAALQLLNQSDQTKRLMMNSLRLMGLKYKINEEIKTLPEADREAIEADYQKLKAILKTQIEALP